MVEKREKNLYVYQRTKAGQILLSLNVILVVQEKLFLFFFCGDVCVNLFRTHKL